MMTYFQLDMFDIFLTYIFMFQNEGKEAAPDISLASQEVQIYRTTQTIHQTII